MSKIPVINAKTMEKVLFCLGFKKIRQKGSHAFYKHPDGRTTTVPHHQGRDLAVPLIKEILKDIKLSVDEFIEIINKVK
ncbi:MAG: type II toxin-antitoxin system HicA family toxin [Sulfurihydrogenibium sp.]|uniref:type II toxin-antitoxin system HicA family toxin n=1 Tax=Sulfurihydrogenibium sp. TaxID=2053621 RepID=UPI003C7EA58C